jgi:mono/diheme cytochrome c family protein
MVGAALALGACGTQGIQVADDDPDYTGAVLFSERCSGCHSLDAAGAQGSANRELRNQGPNLNQRVETADNVLYAIRTGGFSGAIMPQNIVVGDDAEAVADFVAAVRAEQLDGHQGDEALTRALIVDAAYRSADNSAEIRLEPGSAA